VGAIDAVVVPVDPGHLRLQSFVADLTCLVARAWTTSNRGAHGGEWLDLNNLVTACWLCNVRKSDLTLDKLGWRLRPIPTPGWDGLTGMYRALWTAAGQPDLRYHRAWLAALT